MTNGFTNDDELATLATEDENTMSDEAACLAALDGAMPADDGLPLCSDPYPDDVPWPDDVSEGETVAAATTTGSDPEDGGTVSDGLFDVRTAALTVPTLIEASAGTGKTFSIKHLVLRLMIEEDMPIDRLLIVTFTRAATAELASRIREHMTDTLAYLTGQASADETDGLIVEQAALWEAKGIGRETAVERLRRSITRFDDASISTIHSFCQKMLSNHVFTSSGRFDRTFSDDDQVLRQQVVEDFLRRELDAADGVDARKALMEGFDWLGKLQALSHLPADLAPRVFDEDMHDVLERFAKEGPEALRALKRADGTGTFDDLLSEMWEALRQDASGDFAAGIRRTYSGVLIDEFQDTDPLQFAVFDKLFLQIPEAERRAEPRRALFFVGDPKQAIYRFRAADLDTYMRARRAIGRQERLGRNFRSSPALVKAVNAFFMSAQTPVEDGAVPTSDAGSFLRDDLPFVPVDAHPEKTGLYLLDNGVWRPATAFECWTTEAGLSSKGEMDETAVETLANEIATLIGRGQRGTAGLAAGADDETIGDVCEGERTIRLRAVRPGDIAILVKKHKQAAPIEAALGRRGIRIAHRDPRDVFRTEEAEEILRLLYAFESPGDERLMTAARTTRFMGDTLASLKAEDEAGRTALRLCFEDGLRAWRRSGVAAAFAMLSARQHVAERLLPTQGGEARLVNYAHILELLNEAGRRYATPSSLISWFEQTRAETNGSTPEERRIRMASDANLVSVTTIHASKGLQYPIVYLPFGESLTLAETEKGAVFRESTPDGMTLILHHHETKESDASKAKRGEELVRLAYVAMTRAASHLVLIVPQKGKRNGWYANYASNGYFMALCGTRNVVRDDVMARLRRLAELPGVALRELKYPVDSLVSLARDVPEVPSDDLGADPAFTVRAAWRVSSFSSISRLASDDDADIGWFGSARRGEALPGILGFPRGTKAGDCMHHMLEVADFPAVAPDTPEADALRRSLAERAVEAFLTFPDDESKASAVTHAARMIYDVVNAEILPGIRLRDVPMSARASEMPFLLKLGDNVTTTDLTALLTSFGPEYDVGTLSEADLSGFLTGFIDLAFGAGGRFWILDWKSNAITRHVSRPEDFTQPVMAEEMRAHRYRLQYLIYLVALSRFLKMRLGEGFRPEMIGGACYVFLRGVSADAVREGDHVQGVVYDPVSPDMIARLDALFRQGE